MSVAIPDPSLDQHKQQRIEIATRLMEAWIMSGRGGPNSGDEETAKRFTKLAAIIQQKA